MTMSMKMTVKICVVFLLISSCTAENLESSEKFREEAHLPSFSANLPGGSLGTVAEVEAAVSAALGNQHGVSSERLLELQQRLEPSFNAIEKQADGRVSHSGVRWMLHQHFATEHGWVMEGLEHSSSGGVLLNKTSGPTAILRERLPEYVQAVLDAKFERHGFSLADAVAMAATLESLILNDGVDMLEHAFRLNALPTTAALSRQELADVVYAYMMVFTLKMDLTHKGKFRQTREELSKMFPDFGWPFGLVGLDTMEEYLRDREVRNPFGEVERQVEEAGQPYGFADAAAVTRLVGERFGREQQLECMELKTALTEHDTDHSGRVPLLDFYQVGNVGDWTLAEDVAVLRRMGALDETSEQRGPMVMIPNYIHSRSNCVEASDLYKVCCLNECEGFLRSLEQHVQRPVASVEEVVDFVERSRTSSMEGSKVLTLALLDQLEQIAATREDRKVALHTRLFAEWLHFVFPRECPYPHMQEEEATGQAASWEELQHFVTEEKVSEMAAALERKKVAEKEEEARGGTPLDFSRRAQELHEKGGGLHSMWSWEDHIYVSTEHLDLRRTATTKKSPVGAREKILSLLRSSWWRVGFYLSMILALAWRVASMLSPAMKALTLEQVEDLEKKGVQGDAVDFLKEEEEKEEPVQRGSTLEA